MGKKKKGSKKGKKGKKGSKYADLSNEAVSDISPPAREPALRSHGAGDGVRCGAVVRWLLPAALAARAARALLAWQRFLQRCHCAG